MLVPRRRFGGPTSGSRSVFQAERDNLMHAGEDRIRVGDRVWDVGPDGAIIGPRNPIALQLEVAPVRVVELRADCEVLLDDGRVVPSWKLCRVVIRPHQGWTAT